MSVNYVENMLKEFRTHVQEELKKCTEENEYMCKAMTFKDKRCTNKASCNNNTLCKKHKNYVLQSRKVPSFVIYHNHLPSEKSDNCPRCINCCC